MNTLLVTLILVTCFAANADEQIKAQARNIAQEYNIDAELFVALVDLESNFQVAAFNKRTKDYGLTQINAYNIKALNLDAKRLLTDPEYNLRAGAQILAWFQRTYAHREPDWFCRFNVGTGRLGPKRIKLCMKYVDLINSRRPLTVAKD